MEDSDFEADVVEAKRHLPTTKSSSPEICASSSPHINSSGNESTNDIMSSLKVNSHGEIKTNRYTQRVKPPLPKRPRRKKGSQQPTRISSRLAEKRKQEVYKCIY